MVVLINSTFHNTGQSVLAYLLTKMYGNTMNQPCLLMSLAKATFYQSATSLDDAWVSQPASMVLNKTHGKNSFRPFCYKLEDTVYYYHAASSTLSTTIGVKDIGLLLEKAQKDFGMVFVDIDNEINGFVKLIPEADKIVLSIPPDKHSLEITKDMIKKIRLNYEITHGMSIKPDILYALNKYDGSISLLNAAKTLGVKATDVYQIANNPQLAMRKNQGILDHFAADMLSSPKDSSIKIFHVNLTKLLNRLKKYKGA